MLGVKIKNENYGCRVATYGDYVTVSNPATFKWDYATASVFYTGSVEFFRYNKNTNQHDYINTIYQNKEEIDIELIAESSSLVSYSEYNIDTESASVMMADLLIDKGLYMSSADNGFGYALDMYEKLLVIGTPYFTQVVMTSASLLVTASGATVEVHDLGRTEFIPLSQSSYVVSLYNPDSDVTESFGRGVSINNEWIAIGSPYVSSSRGMVYLYRNTSNGSNYSWAFFQTIELSGSLSDTLFGSDLKLNKQTGSTNQNLVVGCGNPANGQAYYFEFFNNAWNQTYTFFPDLEMYPLTFGNYTPYQPFTSSVLNPTSSFGTAVSTFGSTVAVGAYTDRNVYEFSGSSMYEQGSVTIFERCPDVSTGILPRTPNSDIVFAVTDHTNVAVLIGSSSIQGESHHHASIVVNNKFYCGGLDGKLYVLPDPENNPSQVISCSFIAGNYISAVAYSDVTKYLYFINGPTTGAATGSIVRVDPDDIVNGQTIFYQGLPGSITLAPIVCDGPYLYTSTNNLIYKIDATTGALVNSIFAPWGGTHAGTISTDKQWIYFSTNGMIIKVNPSNLDYTTSSVILGAYPLCCNLSSISDDIAYLNGCVYASPDNWNGDIFKINGDDLSYETYRTAATSYGTFADSNNVYHLQGDELWVYFDGNITDGPVRFYLPDISGGFGYTINELGVTDNMVFIVTRWNTNQVYVYRLPWTIPERRFEKVFKTYGNGKTLKNNRLGYSVDMFGENVVAGIPKINNESMTTDYLEGTLDQLHDCEGNLETILNGQTMLLQKNTSSLDWEITNIYQKKKKYLSPYRAFGNDVSIADRSIVVGAPMVISASDANREIYIQTTQSNNAELDDISGKAYIYNLNNLHEEFHVGNVFYRNGKIIVMTSGSAFGQLFFNPINTISYEYDLQFKGQHTIFEKQVICPVDCGEFNTSTNPSSIIRNKSILDINKNGKFDFQDLDVILRYMQYKNTYRLGQSFSTEWSSSIVNTDDEISVLNYYQETTDSSTTSFLTSESIIRWETTDLWMQNVLDLDGDNQINIHDMNIMWKYFTNRLTQENYATYVTPSSNRKLFSDVIDYLNLTSQKTALPQINPNFLDYERLSASDKTGSYLCPFVTSVGLFSGLDLVAVAKLGSPIKLIPDLPFNFVIRLDF